MAKLPYRKVSCKIKKINLKDSKTWFKANQQQKAHAYVAKKIINNKVELCSSSISLCGRNPQKSIQEKIFTVEELQNETYIKNNVCDSCEASLKKLKIEFATFNIKKFNVSTAFSTKKNNSLKIYQLSIKNGVETISFEYDWDLNPNLLSDIHRTSNFISNLLYKIAKAKSKFGIKSAFNLTKPFWIYIETDMKLLEFNPEISEKLNSSIICMKNGIQYSEQELQKIIEKGLNYYDNLVNPN